METKIKCRDCGLVVVRMMYPGGEASIEWLCPDCDPDKGEDAHERSIPHPSFCPPEVAKTNWHQCRRNPCHFFWKDGPSSDLRIQDENLNPLEANKPVSLNLHILNNASETINGRIYELISITGPVTSMDEEYRMEEEKWGVLKKYVETADAVTSPFTPGISWLSVTDPRAVMSQAAIDGIQLGTGSEALRFMLAIQYSDSSGEHELDHCMMIQKPGVYYNCRNHNGPSEPMKHK